ncbi:MAG: BrnT family toxin [Bdellovibrionales bacterium]|nr:BrnT family toxin [Bdellovibrionales bacterium]
MTGLRGKRWYFFVWDDDNEFHLSEHGVRFWEAEEVFFNPYVITPNKKKHGPNRYRIDGKTNGGRRLRLIFEDLGSSTARIITGWDL